jgi:hypothetical protein
MLNSRKFWLGFALVLFLIGIAFLLTPPYGNYCESEHADQKYCAAYEIAVAVGAALEAHHGAITAVATAFIGWFTYTLWRSSEKMWIATQNTLRHAERTAERQLRAYVHPRKPRIVGLFDGGEIKVACEIQNFGQTPAYELVCTATAFTSTDPPGTIIVPGAIGPVSQLDLGPGGSITITQSIRQLSELEIEEIKSGKKVIYFSGNIAYRDTFKDRQTATFLLMKSRRTGLEGDSMAVCPIGNKAT